MSSEESGEGSLPSLGPQTDHPKSPRLTPGKEYLSKARLAAAGLLRASQAADSRPEAVRSRNRAGSVSRKGHGHRCDIAIAGLRLLPQAEDCANPVTALQHLKSDHCPSHVGGFVDPPRDASETTRTRFGDPVGDTQPRSTIWHRFPPPAYFPTAVTKPLIFAFLVSVF